MKHLLTLPLMLCALAPGATQVSAATFTNSTLITTGDRTYDGQDIVVSHCILTVNGVHTFNSLQAVNGAMITHSGGDTNSRLNLTISQNVYVDPISAVDASGMGFGSYGGPGGATNNGAGAGYGGIGGGYGSSAGGPAYGSIITPTDLGSGGGRGYMSDGGLGGGAIQLSVGGTLRIDGLVSASGVASPGDYRLGGGGSGGSVYLTAGTLSGSGTISADGGSGGSQGAGGGGRVALYAGAYSFAGSVFARGGAAAQSGGAGTVYIKLSTQTLGTLLVDNGTNQGQSTPVSAPASLQLTLSNYATAYPLGPLTIYSLHVATNAVLTSLMQQTGTVLTVLGDVSVDRGGVISVDGEGPGTRGGPGGATNSGAGGNYGGLGGGSSGSLCYGSITAPMDLGSGGGGGYMSEAGHGGGAIQLSVSGILKVDGLLSANGTASPGDYRMGGGGSGGSLYLTAGTLSGSGTIRADGGSAGGYGAGGGGRVAIYFNTNTFTGLISAYGGPISTGQPGGAGTIFTKGSSAPRGLVVINNGGTNGATRLNSSFWPPGQVFNLTLAGAARVYAEVPLSCYDLVLSSNAAVSCDGGLSTGVYLTALGTARLDTNTLIDVTSCGSGSGPGMGAGGCGGGYGGAGGGSGGGATYGFSNAPVDLGSAGGAGYMSNGGSGGGALRLHVAGSLQLNGALKADGAPGGGYGYGGAGSGGSIYVTAGSLTGTGPISALGGSCTQGGGGGGRIAIYTTNTYGGFGSISALGGTGGDSSRNGQPGTVVVNTVVPVLQVSSSSPTGAVTRVVGSINLTFNSPPSPASFTADDVVITTPSGQIPQNQITVTAVGGPLFTLGFPGQTNLGQYQVQLGPGILNLYGQAMASSYLSTFTIQKPAIAGTVTTTNGWPVRGLTVRALDGSATTTTDTNGTYALLVAPGWTGTVLPQLLGASFLPANRSYSGLATNQTGQDYTLADSVQPTSTVSVRTSTLSMTWPTIPGLHYQVKQSGDLKAWTDYNSPQTGTGDSLSNSFNTHSAPRMFFRVTVSP